MTDSDLNLVAEAWTRIESVLAANEADEFVGLSKPAGDVEITQLEDRIGTALPPDFVQSYRIHNGQSDDVILVPPLAPLDDGYYLLPIEQILEDWETWGELAEAEDLVEKTSAPDEGVRSCWWHRGWISFASNGGGDSLCIDLAPTKTGTVGQVITLWHDQPRRQLVATSFSEWLGDLAEALEDEGFPF